MSSIEDQEICCRVTPLDSVEAEDESFSCPMFHIDVAVTFMHRRDDSLMEVEEDESDLYNGDCDVIQNEFLVERERLFNQETSMSTIIQILLEMNVPVQSYMLDRILGFARQMATNKRYKNRKVLHMKVEIDVPPGFLDDDDSDDYSAIRFVPASKPSMENLEKIKADGSTEQQCIICLEELLIGSEVTRLPCLHVYHKQCIINWLQKSRFCPLCRFEIA
ncbi:E3 ubiquitin-protein ligase RNF181 [Ricinus communis]|uniref:E3 ubiquitin-protein ligase RNF181 n=1 Tax=Ricinus communis TaxID=3988 RepID=UPI00201A2AF8|nr:E3 ubiquitin-protein ligase RNF181 [Ricinus communis]